MGNRKSLRKSDGFIDDLINLFFLRPVFRDSKNTNKRAQDSSTNEHPIKSKNQNISTEENVTDQPDGKPRDVIEVPFPNEILGVFIQHEEGGSILKIKNDLTTFDPITKSRHLAEAKTDIFNKISSLDALVEDFNISHNQQNMPKPLIIRYLDQINSTEENDGDMENQPPLIPMNLIRDVMPPDDDHR